MKDLNYDEIPEEYGFTEAVGSAKLSTELENNMTTGHNWKTIGGLAIVFLIGGVQALHGVGGLSTWADMALSVLLVIEHGLNGNTTS